MEMIKLADSMDNYSIYENPYDKSNGICGGIFDTICPCYVKRYCEPRDRITVID